MYYFGTDCSSIITENKITATWAIIAQINTTAVVKEAPVPFKHRIWHFYLGFLRFTCYSLIHKCILLNTPMGFKGGENR